jgi:hypothetical protein
LIRKCDFNDSGEYKVILKNNFGEIQSKCILNVLTALSDNEIEFSSKSRPFFVELVKDITIKQGQDVCLKCKITGIPQPELKWYKDGKLINEANNIKVGLNID